MLSRDADIPPLPRWPPNAFKYEPAHGYFLRLAERNAAHSARVFADSVGLNGRNFDIPEILRFCQRLPIAGMEDLIAATPSIEGSLISVNGQKFRKVTDWSSRHPKVCGACLGEARYYRNWWDLTVIKRCPIHDRPLSNGDSRSRLAWWHPAIGVTSEGRDLAIFPMLRSETQGDTWDAYVLGRMGILPSCPVPLLDDGEVYEATATAEFVGKIGYFSPDERPPSRFSSRDELRYQLIILGFSALKGGENRVRNILESYLARRAAVASASKISKARLYRWALSAARNLPTTAAREVILKAMADIALAYGVDVRGNRKGGRPAVANRVALIPLARQLGMSKDRLKAIAKACSLLRAERDKGKYHSFSPADIVLLTKTLNDLLSRSEAMTLLGVSAKRLRALQKSGIVSPFLNSGRSKVMFRKSELEKLSLQDLGGQGSLKLHDVCARDEAVAFG